VADLDATVSKYAFPMSKFLSDYLHSFADYEVTAQGFTSSMIEYMRDSATITTPAIIFLLGILSPLLSLFLFPLLVPPFFFHVCFTFSLECIIQLGILHANFWKLSKEKSTLLLSATSLEYLRSILECRPIAGTHLFFFFFFFFLNLVIYFLD
jgi:hypothetical protein